MRSGQLPAQLRRATETKFEIRARSGDDVEDPGKDNLVFGLFLRNRWVNIGGYNVQYRQILRRRGGRA